MNRKEADWLCETISLIGTWQAWPAKTNSTGIPFVWCTKTDGSTRIYHVQSYEEYARICDQLKSPPKREEFDGTY